MRKSLSLVVGLLAAMGSLLPSAAAAADPPSVYWGAYISGAPFDTTLIDRFETTVGKKMSIDSWGQAWSVGGNYNAFQTDRFQAVRNRGEIPLLTWGSWNLGSGVNQPNFSLAAIAGGTHDAYIRQWAAAAKAWGQPLFLRFDWEMNGWWYPWNEQVNGNRPGQFVAAWRHVHDLFVQQGATNVTWVWCPNIVGSRSTPMPGLYPGDSYVDWTCMDGYNWGTDYSNVWQTFNQVFAGSWYNANHNTYQELLAVAPDKPIMIGETASSEHGGSKASWITDMLLTQLPTQFPKVKAVVWFNWDNGDPALSTWPVESSASSIGAFAQGIAASYYASNQYGTITGKIQPLAGPAPAAAPPPPGTVTLTPILDTYTASAAPWSAAGGSSTTLRSDFAGSDTTFLLFDLSSLAGKTITSANLRVHTSTESWASSSSTFDIKQVYDTQWREEYMSSMNTVPVSSTVLGTLSGTTAPNSWYQTPLALAPIQARVGGRLSAAIVGRTWDVLIVNSRETGATTAPQLVLTYK